MAQITIPIVLDADANAVIFSEAVPTTDVSYAFEMSGSALTAANLASFLQYTDRDDGTALFAVGSTGKTNVSSGLHADISNVSVSHVSGNFPNHGSLCQNGTLGEMLVKYIASVLFGHPEAQAPIKNDDAIIASVQTTSDIHGQFVAALSAGLPEDPASVADASTNDIVLSIFEQLVAYSSTTDATAGSAPDSNRFGDAAHNVYKNMPFVTGDKITFLIQMTGSLTTDGQNNISSTYFTESTVPTIALLFGSNAELKGTNKDELVPKIWQLTITLN